MAQTIQRGKIKKAPATEVVKYLIRPAIAADLVRSYNTILDVNKAHILMLAKTGIISGDVAKKLLVATKQIESEKEHPTFEINPDVEDLYFNLERYLIKLTGLEVGGQQHTARSRNDLFATEIRIDTRKVYLKLSQMFIDLRRAYLQLARKNLDTVMSGYTHMQPSEPITFAHYLSGALSVCKMGKELAEDPEYIRKVQEGYFAGATKAKAMGTEGGDTKWAKLSVVFFLLAAVTVVFVGTFPELRPHVTNAAGKASQVSMTHMIELIMLVVSAIMVLFCKAKPDEIIRTSVFRAGMMGVVTIFGLAWMSDTWIANNLPYIKTSVAAVVQQTPWLFALALFFVSALTHSQGATVAALMPLGLSLGIDPLVLVCMYPAVCGYFIIPSTGVLLGGVAFDETGTTKIGKYVINHSYIIPGLVTTFSNVVIAFGIKAIFF